MESPPLSLLLAGILLSLSAAAAGIGFQAKLTLERAVPATAHLQALKARDRVRHGRILQSSTTIPYDVNFPVEGSANPLTVGLYYTRVKLGTPPKEFYVQIDTGSDSLWVTCNPCSGCPTTSGMNIHLQSFDPLQSSTAQKITCSDERCNSALETGEAICTSIDSFSSPCLYSLQYGDGSGTSGYYVSDNLYFDSVMDNEQTSNSSVPIVFGCSNSQTGGLTKSDRAIDGIFGFGQRGLSVILQLSSMGVAPQVSSHCLKGSDNGGGIFILGEIVEPGIVYTPLVQSQPHYNLNLESIAVNGQILSIDPSVFSTSSTQGTIVDSGTTLAYLAEEAYNPFVSAIIASLPSSVQAVQPFLGQENECFITTNSIDESFPSVTLNFMGNASMELKPQNYLVNQGQNSIDNSIIWCIGWQKNLGQGITLLGDIVLKDKIFVYDLTNQRIGWADYNCSLPVNISTWTPPSGNNNDFLGTWLIGFSGSSPSAHLKLLPIGIAAFLVHVFALLLL